MAGRSAHRSIASACRQLKLGNVQFVDGGFDSSLPYNRRDLNVVDTIQADGKTPGLLVLGGVFKAGQVAGHLKPISIDPGMGMPIQVTWVKDFKQALNHYDCGAVPIFDPASGTMYVTLLGGISQFHCDKVNNTHIKDKVDLDKGIDGLPFIDTVSIVARDKAGKFSQYIWPRRLPGLIGTEMRFLSVPTALAFDNCVLDLSKIKGRTQVGYLYGGIEATEPYSAFRCRTPPRRSATGKLWPRRLRHALLIHCERTREAGHRPGQSGSLHRPAREDL